MFFSPLVAIAGKSTARNMRPKTPQFVDVLDRRNVCRQRITDLQRKIRAASPEEVCNLYEEIEKLRIACATMDHVLRAKQHRDHVQNISNQRGTASR